MVNKMDISKRIFSVEPMHGVIMGSTSKDKLTIFGEEQYMQLVIQTQERKTASKQDQTNNKGIQNSNTGK